MLQSCHARGTIWVAFVSAQARQISEIMFPLRTAELMGVSWRQDLALPQQLDLRSHTFTQYLG